MHAVEPPDEFVGRGRVERDLAVNQVACGALEAFLDRFLGDEEGAGDFRVAEATRTRQASLQFFVM
jgi:hypothetical protein